MFSRIAIDPAAEDQIVRAQREGMFDRLPGLGRPFEFDESQVHPNWWIARKVANEELQLLIQPETGRITTSN